MASDQEEYLKAPYDPDVATVLIAGLLRGQPVRTICAAEGMPSLNALRLWNKFNPAFKERWRDAMAEKRAGPAKRNNITATEN